MRWRTAGPYDVDAQRPYALTRAVSGFNIFGLTHVSFLFSDPPILLDRIVSSDVDDANPTPSLHLVSWIAWQEKLQHAAG